MQAQVVKYKDEWNLHVDMCLQGTILQTTSWAAVKANEGWQSKIFVVKEEDDILIGAQILEKEMKYFGKYWYIPYGPISIKENKEATDFFLKELKNYARLSNVFLIEIEPLAGQFINESGEITNIQEGKSEIIEKFIDNKILSRLKDASFIETKRNMQPKTKLYYDLTQSEEDLLKRCTKSTRYNVKYAQKKGVSINIIDAKEDFSQEHVDSFYKLLQTMQERATGYPIRPKKSFETLLKSFTGANVAMMQATLGADILAANISEKTNMWASSFYMGSNRLHPEVKSPYLLRWESIIWGKNTGTLVYDFWGVILDDKKHAGYSAHKLSFGGYLVKHYGLFAYSASYWKYMLFEAVLKARFIFFSIRRRFSI